MGISLNQMHIAVVIPAYRVEKEIARVVQHIPAFVDHIIVVDDCSPDHIGQAIEPLRSERVRYVRHTTNQGVGGAMLTGYAIALGLGAEVIVKMDGDDQMDSDHLPLLLLPILRGEADYTKGNRFVHTYALGQMPPIRRIGNFGLTFLTKLATGYWNMFDPNNGYTAMHARVLRLINTDAISRRYFFESSVLMDLQRVRAVVEDVPMPARYGEEASSLSIRHTLVNFPINLAKGFSRRLARQYFLYDFNVVSLLLLLGLPMLFFGVIWGAVNWYHSIASGQVASTGTVLLAVLPIIVGFQCLLQALALDIGSVPRTPLHPRLADSDTVITHTARMTNYLDAATAEVEQTVVSS